MNDTSNNFNVAVLGYKSSIKSSFLKILQKETSYLFFGSNILKANLDIGNRNYEIRIYDTPSGINYRFFNIDFYFMIKLDFLIIYDRSLYVLQYTSDILPYGEHRIKIAAQEGDSEFYKLTYWPSVNSIRINSTEM